MHIFKNMTQNTGSKIMILNDNNKTIISNQSVYSMQRVSGQMQFPWVTAGTVVLLLWQPEVDWLATEYHLEAANLARLSAALLGYHMLSWFPLPIPPCVPCMP